MFRVNRRTDYAIRVMLAVAKQGSGARISTQKIQDEMLIPRPFLQRIVAELAAAELLSTFPGPKGGIELARPAEEINLKHVWEAIEGPLLISDCLLSVDTCVLGKGCPVRKRWGRIQTLIVNELESATFDKLVAEAHALSSV
jgi:Rrf2 family protein